MSERYKVVEGSETGHCCFGATVVDTHTPRNGWEEKFDWVCECYGLKDAQKIADALNAAEQSPDVAQLVGALETIRGWLLCAPIATAEDMAQSFPAMLEVVSDALAVNRKGDDT